MRRLIAVGAFTALAGCATPPAAAPKPLAGQASWYNEGSRVACDGAHFHPLGMTTAHRSLPCGTRLVVWRDGFAPVEVIVNDCGPAAWTKRDLDLSEGAARALGLIGPGHALVNYLVAPPKPGDKIGRRTSR